LIPCDERFGQSARRGGAEICPIEHHQSALGRSAQGVRFLQYRIEDRRDIARRRIDDLQYLRGRGLLGERLVTLGSALGKLALHIGYEPLGIG